MPITPSMRVVHDEGLLYEVESIVRSTINYEETRQLGGMIINYSQLEDGMMPIGTRYAKDEEGFRQHFTIDDTPRRQVVTRKRGKLLGGL